MTYRQLSPRRGICSPHSEGKAATRRRSHERRAATARPSAASSGATAPAPKATTAPSRHRSGRTAGAPARAATNASRPKTSRWWASCCAGSEAPSRSRATSAGTVNSSLATRRSTATSGEIRRGRHPVHPPARSPQEAPQALRGLRQTRRTGRKADDPGAPRGGRDAPTGRAPGGRHLHGAGSKDCIAAQSSARPGWCSSANSPTRRPIECFKES